MDLQAYFIPIILDNPLVPIIDIPVVKHVKKYILEYPDYFQNT